MSGQAVAPAPAALGLPALVRQAAERLAKAETAAEVLEARALAGLAADRASREARLRKAQRAHETVIAAAHHAKADALTIEAAAQRRLAEEYEAAQERGEVVGAHDGAKKRVPDGNAIPVTSADLGLSRKHIHEGRMLNKAEKADPGIVERTAKEQAARGEEPSRAAIKRAALTVVGGKSGPAPAAPGQEAPAPAETLPPPAGAPRRRSPWRHWTLLRDGLDRIGQLPAAADVVRAVHPSARADLARRIDLAIDWLETFREEWNTHHEHSED